MLIERGHGERLLALARRLLQDRASAARRLRLRHILRTFVSRTSATTASTDSRSRRCSSRTHGGSSHRKLMASSDVALFIPFRDLLDPWLDDVVRPLEGRCDGRGLRPGTSIRGAGRSGVRRGRPGWVGHARDARLSGRGRHRLGRCSGRGSITSSSSTRSPGAWLWQTRPAGTARPGLPSTRCS